MLELDPAAAVLDFEDIHTAYLLHSPYSLAVIEVSGILLLEVGGQGVVACHQTCWKLPKTWFACDPDVYGQEEQLKSS